MSNDDYSILRLPGVLKETGDKKGKLYGDIRNGTFPPPVKLGPRAAGWVRREVRAINQARIAGKSIEDQRALVRELVASRQAA